MTMVSTYGRLPSKIEDSTSSLEPTMRNNLAHHASGRSKLRRSQQHARLAVTVNASWSVAEQRTNFTVSQSDAAGAPFLQSSLPPGLLPGDGRMLLQARTLKNSRISSQSLKNLLLSDIMMKTKQSNAQRLRGGCIRPRETHIIGGKSADDDVPAGAKMQGCHRGLFLQDDESVLRLRHDDSLSSSSTAIGSTSATSASTLGLSSNPPPLHWENNFPASTKGQDKPGNQALTRVHPRQKSNRRRHSNNLLVLSGALFKTDPDDDGSSKEFDDLRFANNMNESNRLGWCSLGDQMSPHQ